MHNFRTPRTIVALVAGILMMGGLTFAQQDETVTFAGWSGEEGATQEVVQDMISAFEEQAGVDVEWIGFPWSETQRNLILRYRSGEQPEVAQLDVGWLSAFAALDALVDLNEVFGQEFIESRIDPGLLNAGRVDGQQLGLPWTMASIGMVANTQVLENAGVSEVPETVDEFVSVLRQIKESQPDVVPFAFSTAEAATISADFQIWLYAFGGELFDDAGNVVVDSPEADRALNFIVDLMDEGLIAEGMTRFDARRLFARHEAGFYFDAPVARGFARDNSGQGEEFDQYVAAMPTPVVEEGDDPASLTWGHVLVMFKQDGREVSEEDAAAQLMSYLAFDPEPQLTYLEEAGSFPVATEALNSPAIAEDEYVSTWAEFATTATTNETTDFSNSTSLKNAIGEEVQSALLDRKTPEQAIDDMARRLGELVDQAE